MTPLPAVPRVLVIGLDGATYDVLVPLAQSGVMPNLATLLSRSALAACQSTAPAITPVAWTTFLTGAEPAEHGILDYRYLAADSKCLRLNQADRVKTPNLFDAVAPSGDVVSINLPMTYPAPRGVSGIVVGGLDSPSCNAALAPYPEFARRLQASGAWYGLDTIWQQPPNTFAELAQGVARTEADFRGRATAAQIADAMHDWRLMIVQFQTLDSLQHRCWHLLGIEGHCSAPTVWTAKLHEAFRTLDDCLGDLLALAQRRRAAAIVVSDHGFGPFRQKIGLPEILRRRGLLVPADASRHLARWLWHKSGRLRRSLSRRLFPHRHTAGIDRSLASLAPLDWNKTRALTLHGNLAGLVYLNTRDRFGAGPIVSSRQYDDALAETMAAFRDARHPTTEEPLFADVVATRELLRRDPLSADWPDVLAIPAEGFHTQPKFDRHWRLLGGDANLTGTHRKEGVLMVDAPGVQVGQTRAANLRDVAPTILALLGGRTPASMTGRILHELWDREYSTSSAITADSPCIARDARQPAENQLSAAAQAQVESRLRELGYIE